MKPQDINQLPLSPGCYLFKDSSGKIIYVGKAKELRKRVASYFQNKPYEGKTDLLVQEINDIDFITTNTESEAFILENSLIKKHYPMYNIDMKDAQKYAYIRLVQDELPWLETERVRSDSGEYYGPFVSGTIRRQIIEILSRNFKILTRKPSPRYRKLIDKAEYAKRVEKARDILKGRVDDLIDKLEKEMQSCSEKKYYEYALTLRNQVQALQSLKQKQLVELTRAFDAHIFNFILSQGQVYLLVFSIRKGVLEGKEEYSFDYVQDFLDEFIVRFYDTQAIPNEIIVPIEVDPAIPEYLAKKKGRQVTIIVPQRGDKKQLLDLVLKNVHATFFPGIQSLGELQAELQLSRVPRVMECFDISHLSGTGTVASMVSFKDGKPNKSNYRRFKIQSQSSGDDILAMSEVLRRRYSGSLTKSMKNPDLIIIDGGRAQLNAGINILKSLNLSIPIISLAKRLEEIYTPDNKEPIRLDYKSKALHLLQAIRDEAHRFVISYQKILRSKEIKES
jgi:excinuclease ABC subunit C